MQTRKSEELEEKFLLLGVDVINLAKNNKVNLPFSVIGQVIRSSTSIGANYAEAQNASSKADFKNKIYIAKKEASESRYWLRLIEKLVGKSEELPNITNEVQKALLILQKITNTLNGKTST